MKLLIVTTLLIALSSAQTDYSKIDDLASAGKMCTQMSWSVNDCATAGQTASSLGYSSGACDLSTYKKHCSSMDQVTDMSMTNCGTQTMKFFYTECTVCTAAGQTCVNSPGQTDSGNNDSGNNDNGNNDSGNNDSGNNTPSGGGTACDCSDPGATCAADCCCKCEPEWINDAHVCDHECIYVRHDICKHPEDPSDCFPFQESNEDFPHKCPDGTMVIEDNKCAGPQCTESDQASCCLNCWDTPAPDGCPGKCNQDYQKDWCPEAATALSRKFCNGPVCDETRDQHTCCIKCCTADHVSCTACQNGKTVTEQCKDTPDAVGCNEPDNAATLPLGCETMYGIYDHGPEMDAKKVECDGNVLTITYYKTADCETGTEHDASENPHYKTETYTNIGECKPQSLVDDMEAMITCSNDVATITFCGNELTKNHCEDGDRHNGCVPNKCKDICCKDDQNEAYLHAYWSKWSMEGSCDCGTESVLRSRKMEEDTDIEWESTLELCNDDAGNDDVVDIKESDYKLVGNYYCANTKCLGDCNAKTLGECVALALKEPECLDNGKYVLIGAGSTSFCGCGFHNENTCDDGVREADSDHELYQYSKDDNDKNSNNNDKNNGNNDKNNGNNAVAFGLGILGTIMLLIF